MYLNPNKPIDRHRVNLPHWQQGQTWVFVTWRLADSLPKSVVEKLRRNKLLGKKIIHNHGAKPITRNTIVNSP